MATKKTPPPFSLENIPIDVINQEFARRYGQGYSDYGKRFTFGPGKAEAGAEVGPVISPDAPPLAPVAPPPAPPTQAAPWKTPGRRPFDFARQALETQQGPVQSPEDFAREVQQATQSYRAGERAAAEPVRNIAPGFAYNDDMFNPASSAGQSFARPPDNPMKQVEPPKYRGVPVEQRGAEQILNSVLEAEAQQYPDISGADLKTWQAQHPMKPEDRTKIARAIGSGAIDVTSLPPEAIPWAELLNEPGYQTIGKVGMRDPQKAYQWLPNLQQTISKQGLEGMYKERDRLNTDIADLKSDPNKLTKAILEMRLLPEDVAQMPADSKVLQQTLRVFADTPDLGKLGSIGALGVNDPVAGRNALLEYMGKQENNEWNRIVRGLKTGATDALLRGLQKPTVYSQSGYESAANFTGNLLMELPWVMAAGTTGGMAAQNLGMRLSPTLAREVALAEMTGAELPLATQMKLGSLSGLGTGAGVAAQKEAGEFLSNPEKYSAKEGLQRSAATIGEYGLFGAAYPAVEPALEAGTEFLGNKLGRSAVGQSKFGQTVKNIVEKDPFYLPSIGKFVAEKGTGGAIAGGLVGVAKASGQAIVDLAQDPKNVSMRRFAETVLSNLKEEFTEEMLEAITYGLVQGEFKATHSDIQAAVQKANTPRLRAALERARANRQDKQANAEGQRLYWVEDMYRQMTDKAEADKALANPAPVQYRDMPEAAHTWVDTRKSTPSKEWAQDFVQNLEMWNGEGNPSLPADDRGLPQRDRMAMAAYLRGHMTQATPTEAQRAWTSKEYWKLTPQDYISLVKEHQYGQNNKWWTPQEASGWMRDHAAYVQSAIFDGQEIPERVKQYYPNIDQQIAQQETAGQADQKTAPTSEQSTGEQQTLFGTDQNQQTNPPIEQAVRNEPGPPAPPITTEKTQEQLDAEADKQATPDAAMPSTVIDEEAPPVEAPATPKAPNQAPEGDRSNTPDPGDVVEWTGANGDKRTGRVTRRDEHGWTWVKGQDGETKTVHEGDVRIANKAPQYKVGDKIRWTLGDNKYTGTVIEPRTSADNTIGVNWDVPEGTAPKVTNLLKHFIDGYADEQAQGAGKASKGEGEKAPDQKQETPPTTARGLADVHPEYSRMMSEAIQAPIKEKNRGEVPVWMTQDWVKALSNFSRKVEEMGKSPDDSTIDGLYHKAIKQFEKTDKGIDAGLKALDYDLVREYHQVYQDHRKALHEQKRQDDPRSAAIDEFVDLVEHTPEQYKRILDTYSDSVMPSLLEWAESERSNVNVSWWKDVIPLIQERIAGNVDQRGDKAPEKKTARGYDAITKEYLTMVQDAIDAPIKEKNGGERPYWIAMQWAKALESFHDAVSNLKESPDDFTIDGIYHRAIKPFEKTDKGIDAGLKALNYDLVREYYQAVKDREAGGTDQSKGDGQSKPDDRTDINAEGIDKATTGKMENVTEAIHTLRASFVHVKGLQAFSRTIRISFSARLPDNVKAYLKGAGFELKDFGSKDSPKWAYDAATYSSERLELAETLQKHLPDNGAPTAEELTSDEQLQWYMSGRMVQTSIGRDGRPQLRTIDQATGKPVAANAHDAFKMAMQANGWRLTNGGDKKNPDWYWTPLSDNVLAKANDFGRRLAEAATGESKAKPEVAPEEPAPDNTAPPEQQQTGKPKDAPPTFKEGDRVTWTNRKGDVLTGTVKYEGVNPDHVEVRVDQIARAGGVPILRSEQWPIAEMQHLQEEKAPQEQSPPPDELTPAEQEQERKKAFFAVSPTADELEAIKTAKPGHVLLSFALWGKKDIQKDFLDKVGYRPVVMIDSGAWTFKKKGVDTGFADIMQAFQSEWDMEPGSIINFLKDVAVSDREGMDVDWLIANKFMKYIDFLDSNRGKFDYTMNFDTIGDPELTAYAYEVMKAGGYNPIPVFQPGVDVAELDKLVADGEKYIALGGTAMRETIKPRDVVAWVKPILQRHPGVKFHLLGSQNLRQIINMLPGLASYDGSAWNKSAGYKRDRGDLTKVDKAIENIDRIDGRPKGTTPPTSAGDTGKPTEAPATEVDAASAERMFKLWRGIQTVEEALTSKPDDAEFKRLLEIRNEKLGEDAKRFGFTDSNMLRALVSLDDPAPSTLTEFHERLNRLVREMADLDAKRQAEQDAWQKSRETEKAKTGEGIPAKEPWEMTLEEYAPVRPEWSRGPKGWTTSEQQAYTKARQVKVTEWLTSAEQAFIDGKPTDYRPAWSMTAKQRADWSGDDLDQHFRDAHRKAVEQAASEGKPVPAEVLAEYPELAKNDAQYQQVIEYVRGAADPATGIFNQGLMRMLGQNLFGDQWSRGENAKVVSGYVRRLVEDGIVTAPTAGQGNVLVRKAEPTFTGKPTHNDTVTGEPVEIIQRATNYEIQWAPGRTGSNPGQIDTNRFTPITKGEKGANPNANTDQVRPNGEGALGEVPSEDVSGNGAEGDAGGAPVRRAGEDQGRAVGSDRAGSAPRPGMGDGEGESPAPAGRGDGADAGRNTERGPGARGTGKPEAGTEPGPDATADAGHGRDAGGGVEGDKPADVDRAAAHDKQIRPAAGEPDKRNYVITSEDRLGQGSLAEKLRGNIEAVKVLKKLAQEGRPATPDEQKILVRYIGWGGFPQVFNENDPDFAQERGFLKELLTADEYRLANDSVANAHYTSEPVVRAIWDGLSRMGFGGGRILEPAMGTGNFLGLMPGEIGKRSRITGVELDAITGQIAKHLYQRADIRIKGYEATRKDLPDNFFDLAISNVPFGDYGLFDPDYTKHDLRIHDYFFARSLRHLRPGGLIAFITSKGSMDKQNPSVRRLLARDADLVAAVRMPQDAFKDNANTVVTTDLIILRKRAPGTEENGESWMGLKVIKGKNGEDIAVNEYFAAHPEMMMGNMIMRRGRYGDTPESALEPDGRDLGEGITEALKRLPNNVYQPLRVKATDQLQREPIPAPGAVKEHAFHVGDNGTMYVKQGGQLQPIDMPATSVTRIKGLIDVRDAVRRVLDVQLRDRPDAEWETARKSLNAVYDAFVAKNGFIHDRLNRRDFSDDPDYPLLLSLEKWDADTQKATKGDIFSKRTMKITKQVERTENAKDALIASLNTRGRLDWEYMAGVYGKPAEVMQKELAGHVYHNPDGFTWETADEYLSGNVRSKLRYAEQAAQTDPQFAANVEALRNVLPADLKPHEISVRMGTTWIPPRDVQQFIDHLMETTGSAVVRHSSAAGGVWTVDAANRLPDSNNFFKWGHTDVSAKDLVEQALNGRAPTIWRHFSDGTKLKDVQATLAAREKQDKIKEEFVRWLWSDGDRAARLTTYYNENLNNLRNRVFDGSHLELPGAAAIIKGRPFSLRPHQANAIWRIVQTGNTMLAHVVGAGKTYTMVGAAMEMKRLGLAKKSMFVVPNHLTEQWGKEFLEMYPGANVLVTTKDDFTEAKRNQLFAKIATGDWDAVIVGHHPFGKVPMSNENVQQFYQTQLDELDTAIREFRAEKSKGKDTRLVKDLVKAKKKLEARMQERYNAEQKDDTVTFEQLGVDNLFVDEAHEFKNLMYASRMERMSGLQQSDAQKSFDLMMKAQYLQDRNNGRGLVFATGTPISNTLAEMFTMQRYLQMNKLRELGLHNFDAWAANFGQAVTGLEVAPDGGSFRVNTRFAKFTNLPELMAIFRETADVQTADMLKLPTPEIQGGKPTIVNVPATEAQKAYVKQLVEMAKNFRNIPGGMLTITNLGRKAALSMRLVNGGAAQENGKVERMIDNAVSIYRETNEHKGTQLIFSDLGTPGKDKLWDVYRYVRDKLVEAGIPKAEIKFIHQAESDEQKLQLFQDMRQGKVRILLGSSAKMGAGMNVQDRLIALHHLDAPWRPSDIEQREGRIVRQGNFLVKSADQPDAPYDAVRIYRYVTEGTFDAYMWQTLTHKARFIGQVMTGSTTQREAEDVDGSALSYAEVTAIAAGNPLVMEKFSVDQRVQQLDALRADHAYEQGDLRRQLAGIPKRISETLDTINSTKMDIARRQDTTGDQFTMAIGKETFTERAEAGKRIIEQANFAEQTPRFRKTDSLEYQEKIGTIAGFDLYLGKTYTNEPRLVIRADGGSYYASINTHSPEGTIRSVEYQLASFEQKITGHEQYIKELESEQAKLQTQAGQPFRYADEYSDLMKKREEIYRQLEIQTNDQNIDVSAGDAQPEAGGDDEVSGLQWDYPDETVDPVSEARGTGRGGDQGDGGEFDGLSGLVTGSNAGDETDEDMQTIGDLLGMARPRPKQKKDVWPGPHLTPKAAREAADILGKAVNAVIHGQKTRMRRAEGEFDYGSQSGRVKTRSLDDWRVVGHELAHGTDLATRFQGDPRELRKIARKLYPGQISGKKAEPEGLAEFLTLYVVNPKEADTRAPLTFQAWENFLAAHPDLGAAFARIRVTVDADLAGTPLERGMKITSWNRRPSIGPAVRRITRGGPGQAGTWYRRGMDELKAMAEGDRTPLTRGIGDYRVPLHQRLAFRVIDYTIPFQAFHDAATKNGYTGINLAKLAAIVGSGHKKAELDFTTTSRDALGRFLPGRSLQQITQQAVDLIGNQIGWKKSTLSDGEEYGALEMFDAYLHARRAWERYTHSTATKPGYKSPTGATETDDVNYPNRVFQTGLWMTEKHAQQIIDQIEKDFPGMDKLAQEFSETLSEVILTKLQRAGVIDGKTRSRVEKGSLSTHYLPTYYDEDVNWLMPPTGEAGRTANQPVGFFKGRVGAPKDFLTSVMAKLAEVEQSIEYKKVLDTIEAMGQTKGMGAFIEFEKAPYNKVSIDIGDIESKVDQLLNMHTGLSQVGVQALDFWVRGGLKDFSGKDAVLMNWNGTKRTYMRLAPDLFQAVAAMRSPQITLVGRMLARIGRVQRYTGLANPVTMWNIFWRDMFTVGMQTEGDWKGNALGAAGTVSADMLQGWAKVAGIAANLDTELFDLYVSSGGFGGSMQHILETLSKGNHSDGMIYSRATGWKKAPLATGGEILMRVLRTPEEMLRFMEEYPRLAEWMAVFKKEVDALNAGVSGADALEKVKKGQANSLPITIQSKLEKILVDASYASHNITVNTALHGQADWIRSYVQTVPFMQGSIQGVYRFYNQIKQDPVKTGKRAAMYLVPMTLLAWAWMLAGDDDDKEWYNALPHETKDRYWVMRIPGTPLHFGIAKPYEYGIPINLMHRFLDWAKFHDTKHALDGLGKMGTTALLPNDMVNSLLMNSIHLYANKDDAGNAITPMGEQGLAAYQATGPSTSKTAKALSTIGANVADKPWQTLDARHWDYVIKNMIPGGKWALNLTDPIAGALGTKGPDTSTTDWIAAGLGIGADTRTKGIEYAPVVGGLLWGRAERGNRKTDRFYTDLEEARNWTKVVRDASNAKETAPPGITPQSVKLVRALPAMEAVAGEISTLRKTMNHDLQKEEPTPAERKRYLLRYQYVQSMATAMLYGETPPQPPKDAELTPAKVVELHDHFARISQQAMIREAARAGGPSEIANAMAKSLNAKRGR